MTDLHNAILDMAKAGLYSEDSSPSHKALCLAIIRQRAPVLHSTGFFQRNKNSNSLAAASIFLDDLSFAASIGVAKAVAVNEDGPSNNYWITLEYDDRHKLINQKVRVYGVETKKTRFDVIYIEII